MLKIDINNKITNKKKINKKILQQQKIRKKNYGYSKTKR